MASMKMKIEKKVITPKTKLKELYELNAEQTKTILKQMEAYGLLTKGYGVDHDKTLEEHADDQAISSKQLRNMLKSVNRKVEEDSE